MLDFLGRLRLLADRRRRAIGRLLGSECGVYQATNRRLFEMLAMLVIYIGLISLSISQKKKRRGRPTRVP